MFLYKIYTASNADNTNNRRREDTPATAPATAANRATDPRKKRGKKRCRSYKIANKKSKRIKREK